jgi:general secretion pathway protein J
MNIQENIRNLGLSGYFYSSKQKTPQHGFTLMELLVAMSLLSLVFVIVLQALGVSIKAWEKGDASQAEYQRFQAVISLIAGQIRSAYPLKVRDEVGKEYYTAFDGKESSLDFITSMSLSPQFKGGLCFISYFLRDDPTTGTKTLLASEKGVLSKGFFAPDKRQKIDDQEAFELLSGITGLRFEYYAGEDADQGWKNTWDGTKEKDLPKAIRLHWEYNHSQMDLPDTMIIPIRVNHGADMTRAMEAERFRQRRRRTSAFPK